MARLRERLGTDEKQSDVERPTLDKTDRNQFPLHCSACGELTMLINTLFTGSLRPFVLAGRIPELWVTALGTFNNRSVFCPLFSAFGPEPIKARMTIGAAKVLVTTETLYQRKVAGIREVLPALEHVLFRNRQLSGNN